MIIPEDNLEMNKGDPRKTRDLINEMTSRKCGKNRNICAITIDDNAKTLHPKWRKLSTIFSQLTALTWQEK